MNKATSTLIAAVAALTLSGGAYAQSNNSDSGRPAGSANSGVPNSVNGSTPAPTVWPSNNSLARPSVVSPAAGQ
jgi:hypothetical protein